jgi:hypothetical protein
MKPTAAAGPQLIFRSDMPGNPAAVLESHAHNLACSNSLAQADAASRTAGSFSGWKPGMQVQEWLFTCDRVSADSLTRYAWTIQDVDPELCAEIRGVVKQMLEFLKIPMDTAAPISTDEGEDHSIRLRQCTCTPGHSCRWCLLLKANTDAIIEKAQARRDALQAAEQAQERERAARQAKIAGARAEGRQARRAAVTQPDAVLTLPGIGEVPVYLRRLDQVHDIETAAQLVGDLLRLTVLAVAPATPADHRRAYGYEAARTFAELRSAGVIDDEPAPGNV